MLTELLRILSRLGWSKPKDTYEPEHEGHWSNIGDDDDEKWEWKDHSVREVSYANVVRSKGGVTIIVGDDELGFAIECIKCNDKRELEIAVGLLESYYKVLGSVSVDMPNKV